MNIKDFKTFQKDCCNKFCNRRSIYNLKTCMVINKQIACYEKFLIQTEKQQTKFYQKVIDDNNKLQQAIENGYVDNIDVKWEKVKEVVWNRDCGFKYDGCYKVKDWKDVCVIWNFILTIDEKAFLLRYFHEDMLMVRYVDNLHIESRQQFPDLIYDTNNIILASRFFHYRFDNYFDLLTNEPMNEGQRNVWKNRFKNYIIFINRNSEKKL
jgi:hypothetical protein